MNEANTKGVRCNGVTTPWLPPPFFGTVSALNLAAHKMQTRGDKMGNFELYLRRVGRNIKSARQKAKLTQTNVSEESGIESRYYQRMEAGKINMTLLSLFRLAKLFKTEVYILTNGAPQNSTNPKNHLNSKNGLILKTKRTRRN